MKHFSLLLICLSLSSTAHAAKEILLRLQPTAEAPVIAKVTASEKVILDAAPAPKNAELGWRQLALPTPFEGYVPTAALGKNFEIAEGTAAHYLPTAESAAITRVEAGDTYEVVRVQEEWATMRFRKNITGYFVDDSTEEIALNLNPLQPARSLIADAPASFPTPQPVAIPAPRSRINPDEPIGQLDPNALPEENVVWKPAAAQSDTATQSESESESIPSAGISNPASRISNPASRISKPAFPNPASIMVAPDQTQAREAARDLGPAKTPRLLAGQLVRQINVSGPGYPIRLKSPEGRLIAYVDLSKIYISDLTPYIDQKVYIRGQIHPLPNTNAQLVILADSLRLAH